MFAPDNVLSPLIAPQFVIREKLKHEEKARDKLIVVSRCRTLGQGVGVDSIP